jgi:hypothetical protein
MHAAKYEGSLGLIQTAGNVQITEPLTKDWKSHLNQAEKLQVDPNGVHIVDAIDRAASLLPRNAQGKREGTVVLLSDGTISESQSDIATEASKLTQEGVRLKAIVPGTPGGTYTSRISHRAVPAAAESQAFSSFGAQNVIEAKDAATVRSAIAQEIADAGTSHERHPSYLIGMLGGLAFAYGFGRNHWQRSTKKI